ncbi:MAG: hypothetical protein ABGZ17_24710 [Planctomycetaceae bacterium]
MRRIKGIAVALACLGIALPANVLNAAADQTKQAGAVPARTVAIGDVALGNQGLLLGQAVDHQGHALDGAVVKVYFGDSPVAQVVADQNGKFAVQGLRGGVHRIVAGQSEQIVRLWASNTAPPAAQQTALVVENDNAVRGQLGGVDIFTLGFLGASVTAAVFAINNYSDIDDLEDEIDDLQQQIDNLPSS